MRIYCLGKVCDVFSVTMALWMTEWATVNLNTVSFFKSSAFYNRAFLNGGKQSILCFGTLSPRYRVPGLHLTGLCVGPGASEHVRKKSQFLPKTQPWSSSLRVVTSVTALSQLMNGKQQENYE